ncbi:MAG: sporulation initiation factor Spo0A C-terminal domain-containing protein [Lachnospiraceae bacterium]
MISSMEVETVQEESISCENWTAENFLQLFEMLKENRGLKLTLSFGEEKTYTAVQRPSVGHYLTRLGIGRHLNGFSYIKTGIMQCLEMPQDLESVTKLLYPAIAAKHQTTAGRVEHGIRHAITLAWNGRNQEEWEKVFGYRVHSDQGKPTNTEFLAALTDYLLLEWGI